GGGERGTVTAPRACRGQTPQSQADIGGSGVRRPAPRHGSVTEKRIRSCAGGHSHLSFVKRPKKGGALRRLPHRVGALAVLVAGILIFVGPASADKPPPGSHPVHFVDTDPTKAGLAEPVNLIDPSGRFLPSASCGLALLESGGVHLTADVSGWETDPDP